jgi:hypothetical protein
LDILQDFAPEMDLSNTKLNRDHESKRADIAQLFRSGYWKITMCGCFVTFTIELAYFAVIYTASDVASIGNSTSTINELQNDKLGSSSGDLYSTMVDGLDEFA